MSDIVESGEEMAKSAGLPSPAKGLAWVLAAILLVWLMVALPAALGEKTFWLRDVFSNNFPQKAFGAEQLKAGRIPALNPNWALGQPFRGNPATLAFYPGNLLYLLLPFWSAFNLHFVLHWLLALFGMRALARSLDQSPAASLLAGLTYAGGGWYLSTLSFYNIVAVAAWWPWVMAGAVLGGRRGLALGGVACGFALLAGEPITAFLALVPLLCAVVPRWGWRRSLVNTLVVGALGLAIALPQLVATARIYGFSFRGGHGNFMGLETTYYLQPLRLFELLVPFPFGWHSHRGVMGVWVSSLSSHFPFYFSIYCGAVALVLAFAARRRAWWAVALGGLGIASLNGSLNDLLTTLSFGLFRYPEKFLVWFALALPVLAGWGLDRLLGAEPPRWWRRGALAGGGLALLGSILLILLRPGVVEGIRQRTQGHPFAIEPSSIASAQFLYLALSLFLAGCLVLATLWCLRGRRGALVVGLQGLALLQLFPLIVTDDVAPYAKTTPWEAKLGPGSAALATSLTVPPWHRQPGYPLAPLGNRNARNRAACQNLYPAPGSLHGISYPFALNLEGLNSPFCTLLEINMARLDWPQRVNWFQVVGLNGLVAFYEPPEDPRLELLDTAEVFGETSRLFRVKNPAPKVWWPATVGVAPNPPEALRQVSFAADPVSHVVTSAAVEHDPQGKVRLIEEAPDRIELAVESRGGGLAVLQRAFHPLLRARTDKGEALQILPVNLILTGVVVPPGRPRVVLAVDQVPEVAAGILALLALVAALWVARRSAT